MPWTDHKPWVATERDCNARWAGDEPGKRFRCGFCGYKFKVGDLVRWVFTNDIPGAGGNPLVCEKCDGPEDEVRAKWAAKWERMRTEFWWWLD